MAKTGMREKVIRVYRNLLSEAAGDRMVVTAFLVLACTLVTVILFSLPLSLINYEFFFIPVLYTAYFSARRGLVVAGICGIVYLAIGYFYRSPDPAALTGVVFGALLFLIIAGLLTFFTGRIRAIETRYRSVFSHSPLGIVEVTLPDFRITQEACGTFAAMLHYREGEIARMTLPSLVFTPPEKKEFLEQMEQHQDGGNFELRFRTKEGTSCRVNLSWCPLDEQTVSITVVNIDALRPTGETGSSILGKYRPLTENSPAALVVLQEGRIRFANTAFGMFCGYSPQELEGKDPLLLLDSRDADTFGKFKEPRDSGTLAADGTAFRFVTKSGRLKVAMVFASPIVHDEREATLLNLVDISLQQRLDENIRQDNEHRWSIIITIAHELRTPLQPILGYLSLLVQDPEGFGIKDEVKKMLGRCLVSVERERQIINHMLELSVLDGRKIQLTPEDFSVSALVQSVLDTGGYRSMGDVTLDIPKDLIITADRDRLYSVLDSLLSNAVSYSRPPRTIRISYHPGAGGTTHTISVQDNGIGIPTDKCASIFEPFQLADAAKLSRKYDRLGLSLSIAKKIIRMHGGDITVESTLDAGSTFTLHIPRELPGEIPYVV
jgi:PAS domain S-box-containing protein